MSSFSVFLFLGGGERERETEEQVTRWNTDGICDMVNFNTATGDRYHKIISVVVLIDWQVLELKSFVIKNEVGWWRGYTANFFPTTYNKTKNYKFKKIRQNVNAKWWKGLGGWRGTRLTFTLQHTIKKTKNYNLKKKTSHTKWCKGRNVTIWNENMRIEKII